MKFRTEIQANPLGTNIGYDDNVLLFGSCFADEMRRKMLTLKFRAAGNFTGPLFNPASIAAFLRRVENPAPAAACELQQGSDGLWFHYDANTLLSHPSRATALQHYNDALGTARSLLPTARCVIITFGTAWVYRLRENGHLVANCHKQPQALFQRERLEVGQIVGEWSQLLTGPLADKQVILTISPIRHLNDGAENNSLSKAILRLAVAELTERFAHAHYFPAYEILLDDLRDYRFYADDLVHPSAQAVEYIWEQFTEAALSERTQTLLPEVKRLVTACSHRPLHPESAAHRQQCRRILDRLAVLKKSSGIDFSEEIAQCKGVK